MNIATYWNEKKELLNSNKEVFKNWNMNDQIIVRKIIISKVMDVTINNISYYLNRDEWLKNFSCGDTSEVAPNDVVKEELIAKANKILIEEFYAQDAKDMQAICNEESLSQNTTSKNDVCELIKELLVPETFEKLTDTNKNKVELYEKLYFEPIELINEYIKDKAGADVYYTVLL